jgi:RNA-directed DNA polymerase
MIKTSINLQDLRRRIYIKAKAEKDWRFWGLYTHIFKMETLQEAYRMAKNNKGAPGIDGLTFDEIEQQGVENFLKKIQQELKTENYVPKRNRKKEIPKDNGKVRILGIPTIRDRVVQGAAKLILEPIFEADFQEGSFGYRPKRTAHEAIQRVAKAIVEEKTRVIDLDLKSYFDTVRHDILLNKVAKRIDDDKVMRLLKLILKASGKKGVPQGGVISTLLANIYLNEVDKMLEKAKEATRNGKYTYVEYTRFADDMVILIDGYKKWDWLEQGINKRLREELLKLDLQINEEKTKSVDLTKGEKFSFLGFDFRRVKSRKGKWRPQYAPKMKARTKLLRKLKDIFRRMQSQPIGRIIELINPILRGWVNYFRVGHSSRCFGYIKDWVEKKLRRHLMKTRKRKGFGWKRWSRDFLYQNLGLYGDYRIKHTESELKVKAVG